VLVVLEPNPTPPPILLAVVPNPVLVVLEPNPPLLLLGVVPKPVFVVLEPNPTPTPLLLGVVPNPALVVVVLLEPKPPPNALLEGSLGCAKFKDVPKTIFWDCPAAAAAGAVPPKGGASIPMVEPNPPIVSAV
jgi:hypothetical protein